MSSNKQNIAIVVLASTETHEGLGRAVNALVTAKEAHDAGADVDIVFDGAGVEAAAELADPDHKAHGVYAQVKDNVSGVCAFCARSFGVEEKAQKLEIPFIDEYKQHPSLYGRIANGAQIVTF